MAYDIRSIGGPPTTTFRLILKRSVNGLIYMTFCSRVLFTVGVKTIGVANFKKFMKYSKSLLASTATTLNNAFHIPSVNPNSNNGISVNGRKIVVQLSFPPSSDTASNIMTKEIKN